MQALAPIRKVGLVQAPQPKKINNSLTPLCKGGYFFMTAEQITQLIRQTLFTALEIAVPFLIIAFLIGTLFSFIQALTHVQEMTLAFVPKMIGVAVALAIFFPWMLKILTKFTNNLLIYQWEKIFL
jgi:flagellar biosynthetic protein FliQ